MIFAILTVPARLTPGGRLRVGARPERVEDPARARLGGRQGPGVVLLSQLVGKPISDASGERIAVFKDAIARLTGETYPPLTGLVARVGRREFFIPWSAVAEVSAQGVKLSTYKLDVQRFARRHDEVLLAKDVLDKQIIDVDGRRVVRVNDLQIGPIDGVYRLIGADVGAAALFRRLGLGALTRESWANRLIDWGDVQYLAPDSRALQLKVRHDNLARLHPVEIARLIDSLSARHGQEILASLDDETAADTLEEMTEERQADLIEGMSADRAADLLERMAPDEAADLLSDLDRDRAEQIIAQMEPDEAEDVQDLLLYERDTAGGLMTTDFVAVPATLTVGETIRYLRNLEEKPEALPYIYVIRSEQEPILVGLVTLKDLLLAAPETSLVDIMETDFQTVRPSKPAKKTARLMAQYNLLALPVVDDDEHLLGIVTVDDAMDVLLPEKWKKKLPRLFAGFSG